MVTYIKINGNWHEAWFTTMKTVGGIGHIGYTKCGLKEYSFEIRKKDVGFRDVCGECNDIGEVICPWRNSITL